MPAAKTAARSVWARAMASRWAWEVAASNIVCPFKDDRGGAVCCVLLAFNIGANSSFYKRDLSQVQLSNIELT